MKPIVYFSREITPEKVLELYRARRILVDGHIVIGVIGESRIVSRTAGVAHAAAGKEEGCSTAAGRKKRVFQFHGYLQRRKTAASVIFLFHGRYRQWR